jgi:hypothetical protein
MNEEISTKLLEYLQKTSDFALEQMPDIVIQTLKYQKFSIYLNMLTMGFLIILCAGLAYYFYTHPKFDKYGDKTILSTFGVFIPLGLILIFLVDLIIATDNVIKINIAPKYYLIELFSKLANRA